MTITALSGPIVQFGTVMSSTGGGSIGGDMEHNEQRAPAVLDLGVAMLDPRAAYNYDPGTGVTVPSVGLYFARGLVDYVPTTLSTNAFVSATVVATGVTAFTLNAASSAAGTYATTITAPETGRATGALLAIDSTAAMLAFGTAGTINLWNPGAGSGRAVSITTSSSGDLGTYSVAGRDMYGFKMTETLAITQGTSNAAGYTIIGQKAFKYISAISNTTTPTSTGVSIGIADTFGFPMLVPYTGQNASVFINATAFSSAGGIGLSSANTVLGSTVATQTSTTPDVRGVYKSSVASNNTLRLQMTITPAASAAAQITSTNVAPFFGQAQFSSV